MPLVPVTVMLPVLPPLQASLTTVVLAVGEGPMETVTALLVAVQPLPSVVVTVYVVADVGVAIGLCKVDELKLAEGLHE